MMKTKTAITHHTKLQYIRHVDGKGHKLHNHIIVNKTNLNDGKQWIVDNLNEEWRSFREINDAVCREIRA